MSSTAEIGSTSMAMGSPSKNIGLAAVAIIVVLIIIGVIIYLVYKRNNSPPPNSGGNTQSPPPGPDPEVSQVDDDIEDGSVM